MKFLNPTEKGVAKLLHIKLLVRCTTLDRLEFDFERASGKAVSMVSVKKGLVYALGLLYL